MSFLRYVKDCIDFAKRYPYKREKGNKYRVWLRNVLYLNAQPKYWHGRVITKLSSTHHHLKSQFKYWHKWITTKLL